MTAAGFDAATAPGGAPTPPPAAGEENVRAPRRTSGRVARWVILGLAAIYFVGPIIAAFSFTVQDSHGGISFDAYRQIFETPGNGQVGFGTALVYSLEIAVITIVIALALMLPTQLLLHLRFTRVRPLVEVITLLPLVFPPVVLVVGINAVYGYASGDRGSPLFKLLRELRQGDPPLLLALTYVILAMPFVYRALDAGVRSIDAKVLVEAARNLGASYPKVLLQVLVPCLRTALVNAAFLCFALVMGEFTIASILLYTKPFPVWLAQLPTNSGQVQAAVSVFSLLLVEVLLLVIGTLNLRRPTDKKG